MTKLPLIAALYAEIDNVLETRRTKALAASDATAVQRVDERLRLNDQAYFVLAWGQLEDAIDAACRAAIQRGQNLRDWRRRRAWSIYSTDDPRLSGLRFHDRAALVLRRDRRPNCYALAMKHYDVRNQIAHGSLLSDRIDVTNVIQEFYLVQSALTP